jgi:hypothetical protein
MERRKELWTYDSRPRDLPDQFDIAERSRAVCSATAQARQRPTLEVTMKYFEDSLSRAGLSCGGDKDPFK